MGKSDELIFFIFMLHVINFETPQTQLILIHKFIFFLTQRHNSYVLLYTFLKIENNDPLQITLAMYFMIELYTLKYALQIP